MTPYEVYRGSKPNLSHLRTFGCIGYAKVVNPHLKKLEDRSRVLIHLGTEPGSKAYRMYDPQTRKISVSRDVIFDETKGWNWEESEQSTTCEFKVALGTFGNHGLMEEGNSSNESPIQKNEEIKMENEVVASENEEEGEEEEEETEPILRRSHRQANPPKYLEDYILMAEVEEEGEYLLMCLDNEPRDFSDASKSKEWIAACEDELR